MDHAFYTWLQQNASPGRFGVLVVAIDTLRDLFGPEVDELTITILSRIGYDDRFSTLDRLESDILARYSVASNPFSVQVSEDSLSPEQLENHSVLLRALLTLDRYEFPQVLFGILEGEGSPEEVLAELVAEVMYCDAEDILPLLQTVNPVLITRIRENVEAKLKAIEQQAEDETGGLDQDTFTKEERDRLIEFIRLDDPNPIGEYIAHGGICGLPIDRYIQFFGHHLAHAADPKTTAKGFATIALMARIPVTEVSEQCGQYFDQVISNIHRIMAVRKALDSLIKTLQV